MQLTAVEIREIRDTVQAAYRIQHFGGTGLTDLERERLREVGEAVEIALHLDRVEEEESMEHAWKEDEGPLALIPATFGMDSGEGDALLNDMVRDIWLAAMDGKILSRTGIPVEFRRLYWAIARRYPEARDGEVTNKLDDELDRLCEHMGWDHDTESSYF